MSPAGILVVEDEPHLAEGIRANLEAEGHRAWVAADGEAGFARWQEGGVDLMILDIMLPRQDGLSVCRRIRASGGRLPILFLTAKNSIEERVAGLEAGGDDYLGKPFALRELLLRVAAMLRRQAWLAAPAARPMPAAPLVLAGHRVDFASHEVHGPQGPAQVLPQKELMILRLLYQNQNQVVSRDDILHIVWGQDAFPSSRTVDNFIVRLRRRFEPEPQRPRHLHTVRGVGYRLTLDPQVLEP